jgi:hypothetical protein
MSNHPRQENLPSKRKEPPGNGTALSSGRIVPTEANPSELSGCIVGVGESSVKGNVLENNSLCFNYLTYRIAIHAWL